jgi:hypothetical protein
MHHRRPRQHSFSIRTTTFLSLPLCHQQMVQSNLEHVRPCGATPTTKKLRHAVHVAQRVLDDLGQRKVISSGSGSYRSLFVQSTCATSSCTPIVFSGIGCFSFFTALYYNPGPTTHHFSLAHHDVGSVAISALLSFLASENLPAVSPWL